MKQFELKKSRIIRAVLRSDEVIELRGGAGAEPIENICKTNSDCELNGFLCGIHLDSEANCGVAHVGNCASHKFLCYLGN